jgi:hypothetical protein
MIRCELLRDKGILIVIRKENAKQGTSRRGWPQAGTVCVPLSADVSELCVFSSSGYCASDGHQIGGSIER